jgi:hypothetical protein
VFWRRHYAEDPNVVGRNITIGGRPFTVVGISPSRFPGLRLSEPGNDPATAPQLWIPLTSASRPVLWLAVGARLSRGTDLKAFQARLAVTGRHAAQQS